MFRIVFQQELYYSTFPPDPQLLQPYVPRDSHALGLECLAPGSGLKRVDSLDLWHWPLGHRQKNFLVDPLLRPASLGIDPAQREEVQSLY